MHDEKIIEAISHELQLKTAQVRAVADLLAEDSTVPFIARYRKEVTGGLDEVAIISIRDRLLQLAELNKRKIAILKSMEDNGHLTPELEKSVREAETISSLEDIYLPYRPKKRTRATIAREKGLEPLAEMIFAQESADIESFAASAVDPEKGIASVEDALQGARDIMAEWINENSEARESMRALFTQASSLSSKLVKGKEKEAVKYRDYFDWAEPAHAAPSHRILAVLRGVDEGVLSAHFLPGEEEAINILEGKFLKGECPAREQVKQAALDSYRRLMGPSMETETRTACRIRAEKEAIRVFAENVRELLLSSPLGEKSVLALDPGLRTGCKLVCLSSQGNLVHNTAIYPLEPHNKIEESGSTIRDLCKKYRIEAIAIGNGTGGREALAFCRGLGLENIIITMVNESGASVYSASKIARTEFPDHDVTVRGAVSIGRRLMDPLAELVKIDPKSIGVGQYQHDVDQKELRKSLDDVVLSCVNAVGVEVNTASGELLRHVSGLSPKMADSIVSYRSDNGAFRSRQEIMKVPGMGPKTFEQSAGFLRIRGADNPLDGSSVHPESYHIVEKMALDLSCSVGDLVRNRELREKIKLEKYVTDEVGMPTLRDIYAELDRPGRDPRREFELFSFTDGVNEISDLEPGMSLTGVVTNVTAFGAFVDIGVHQDGLVHISQISDSYVSDPHSVLKVNQQVTVTVMDVDSERNRISLSMKSDPSARQYRKPGADTSSKKPAGKTRNKQSKKGPVKKAVQADKKPDRPESPFAGLADMLKNQDR